MCDRMYVCACVYLFVSRSFLCVCLCVEGGGSECVGDGICAYVYACLFGKGREVWVCVCVCVSV